MAKGQPRIAITMGDPAGVGPELALIAANDPQLNKICSPIIYGDARILAQVADALGLDSNATRVFDLSEGCELTITPGEVSQSTGRAAFRYIEAAIAAALSGEVDAVATAPIHKEALNAAGITQPGHTEIFAELTNAPRHCMMLTSDEITCSFATGHMGLRDVPESITTARIREVIELTDIGMRKMRSRQPRLTVCGLNPHAGEHGLFGAGEEERLISPAIEQARRDGFLVQGPLPPDTAFVPSVRAETDCYVCMYHDQGLIPLKALAFDTAVNVTLGLPIVRTSVDHGTALDIAWRGEVNPTSMLRAVQLAAELATA